MRFLFHEPHGSGAARRPRARLLVAAAILAAWLGWAVESAEAAYTAKVTNGRLVVTGNGAGDQLALRLEAGVPTTLQVDVGNNGTANFSFDRGLFNRILVNAGGGNDTVVIDQVNGSFADPAVVSVPTGEAVTLNGETGNDALVGGAGRQILSGGRGNDTVDGNQGDDVVNLGDGADAARWDPGDGNDVVNGQGGVDTFDFNGSGASEAIDLSATGPRLRFFRNVGNVIVDAGTLERVVLDALGGADLITLQNLKATPITQVTADLDGVLGSGAGDGQMDGVTFLGSGQPDVVNVSASGATMTASGLEYSVRVVRPEAANDRLDFHGSAADRVNVNGTAAGDSMTVAPISTLARVTSPGFPAPVDVAGGVTLALRGLGGPDSFNGSGNLAALGIPLRFEGGPGNDQLGGGNGSDRLLGGPGNDAIDGNQGTDNASGGDGADVLVWDPGDGNDVIRGDGGTADLLAFNGSAAGEIIDVRADGPRLRFFRNVGNVIMNVDGVERVLYRALGGADTITVRNLAPTDVGRVTVDLASTLGGSAGDAQIDTVIVNGTSKRDLFTIGASGTTAVVGGLAAQVRIAHPEAALDELVANGLGGHDRFTIGSGLPALIGVTVNQ